MRPVSEATAASGATTDDTRAMGSRNFIYRVPLIEVRTDVPSHLVSRLVTSCDVSALWPSAVKALLMQGSKAFPESNAGPKTNSRPNGRLQNTSGNYDQAIPRAARALRR